MKKLKILIFLIGFMFIGNVSANEIKSINMNIYIDNQGTAHVTETWDANLTSGTEGYKPYYNIGTSEFENFTVSMDKTEYTPLNNWSVSGTLTSKSYKSGINYISNGLELCFGISSYGKHIYTLKYDITNFVTRTNDADMVYWTLMPYDFSASPDKVYIKIYSDFEYENTLDVWGYGNYGGTAYVYDGYIEMESNGNLSSDEYMTILIKFPLNTFTGLDNEVSKDFNYYFEQAEEGTTHYVDNNKTSMFGSIISFLITLFGVLIWIFILATGIKSAINSSKKSGSKTLDFGTTGKTIPNDINMFRELPCGKDIYRAYWIAKNYNLMKKDTDFLGTILLKWLKQGKIQIKNNTVGLIFKKEETTIQFPVSTPEFDTSLENELYDYMYKASKDGILESKEFETWCNNNYSKILKWFDDVLDYENNALISEGKLTEKETKMLGIFPGTTLLVDPSMKDEAIKMKGLKLFFNEFENMKDKSAIEVMLWEEYLMYAQIFGVAEKVAKEFKKLYPETITDYSYNSIVFIHTVSYSGMHSATTAQSRARSYSSGGGGFSSGGGGGGSFGGGGGGGGFR